MTHTRRLAAIPSADVATCPISPVSASTQVKRVGLAADRRRPS
jgi:hypothetical protein